MSRLNSQFVHTDDDNDDDDDDDDEDDDFVLQEHFWPDTFRT